MVAEYITADDVLYQFADTLQFFLMYMPMAQVEFGEDANIIYHAMQLAK